MKPDTDISIIILKITIECNHKCRFKHQHVFSNGTSIIQIAFVPIRFRSTFGIFLELHLITEDAFVKLNKVVIIGRLCSTRVDFSPMRKKLCTL
jgi:hypothetical protein